MSDVIGTAWLVLSHGAWVGAALACFAIGLGMLFVLEADGLRDKVKPNSIGWIATGIFVGLWTLYAISVTWRVSRQLPDAIFDDFGFSFLTVVVLVIIGMGVWSIVVISIS